MPLNREWKVRPSRVAPDTGVQSWEVEAPDGTVTNCVTGSIAIDLARKLTKQSKGILLAYASDGRVWATEDYQVH
jgi:outer membrane protein assembly factor BamB